jgi:iron complex outermembrane receptor protein
MSLKFNRKRQAMGTAILAAFAAAPVAAYAQTAYDFKLPSQPLADSLRAIGSKAGVNVVFEPSSVSGRTAPVLQGSFSPQQALDRVLAGSGLVVRSTAGGSLLVESAGPQDAGAQNEPAAAAPEVVVTGTRIRGETPAAPVHTVTHEDIRQSGYAQVGDLIRSIPENFGGGQNPGVMNTGGGPSVNLTNASTVNLRGLGADATLTLLNGHRLPDNGIFQAPDISAIPLAAVDHVEIVTDGASALYGADAVAGVVNFVLRKNYNGAEVSDTVGVATQGGGFEDDFNVLGGKTWDSGHALISAEYFHQDPILTDQRAITETAPRTNDLIASQSRVSIFATGAQDLTNWASFHVDAMYSERNGEQTEQLSSTSGAFAYEHRNTSFLVAPGLTFNLPRDWTASIDGTVSQGKDDLPFTSSLGETGNSFYQNSTDSVEFNSNGALFELPSGEIKVAIGGGYRQEGFRTAGSSSGIQSVDTSRGVGYAYGEALIPLVSASHDRTGLEQLELSLAGRFEHYSDFGSTSNPKVGLRYVPIDGLTLRGTWGTSFKAPTFYQLFSQHNLEYFDASLFGGPTPGFALVNYGGNPDLQPERATSWTAGVDWSPPQDHSLQVSATYFNIDYTDRIALPISSPLTSLSNPIFAPFVVRNPSATQLAAAIASAPIFENFSSGAYNPSQTVALLEDLYTNVTAQKIDGIDLSVLKSFSIPLGGLDLFGSATIMRITQQTIPTVPAVVLTGTLFNPPTARFRAGGTWTFSGFNATGIVNYVAGESDTNVAPAAPVGSWITVDLNLAYRVQRDSGLLSGTEASLAVTNLLDQAPPYARGAGLQANGIFFDSTNTSAIGRFMALTLRKRF